MRQKTFMRVFLASFLPGLLCVFAVSALCHPHLSPEAVSGSVLWMALTVLCMLIITLIASAYVARKTVEPFQRLDPQHPENTDEELRPLLRMLQEQSRTIRQQGELLARERQDFAAITNNMSEGFLLLDKRLNIVSDNAAARRFFPKDYDSGTENLNSNGCPAEICTAAERALAGHRVELTMEMNGRFHYIIASPVAAMGGITGAVIITMDTTEREQQEALRREFTANVSHELKTPLTSINGFAELLQSGMVAPERVGEFAGDIYKESQRLICLVNDILELSRLEEQKQLPEKTPNDLYEIASQVLETLHPAAEKLQVSLALEGEHAEVLGVHAVLQEMVYNLCDNAVKYNRPGGSVTVRIENRRQEAVLSVTDTGIGIPLEHQGRIFERFYRVDKSHSRQMGGTGLGLSIVKHGAQMHKARLELHSEPDRGTCVTVGFPK